MNWHHAPECSTLQCYENVFVCVSLSLSIQKCMHKNNWPWPVYKKWLMQTQSKHVLRNRRKEQLISQESEIIRNPRVILIIQCKYYHSQQLWL